MTRTETHEVMRRAHAAARVMMATPSGRAFYGSYAKCLADMLRSLYASKRRAAAPALVSGFQVVEPKRHDWQNRNAYSFGNYQRAEG